jgi:hypothetical protein
MAITSKEINLFQLDEELGGQGLVANFNDPENKLILPAEGSSITEEELTQAIEKHSAINQKQKKADLLNRLGITENEVKLLLG